MSGARSAYSSDVAVVGVCEDDAALRSVLTRALRLMGHDPVVVATAAEALRAFASRRPDALVLDIGLPDADGRDLCVALRAAGVDAPVEAGLERSKSRD